MTRIIVTLVVVALSLVAWRHYGISKGLDLLGGVELRFKLLTQEGEFEMDEVITILKKRADPSGTRNIPVQRLGPTRIRIAIPEIGDDELQNIINRLQTMGVLQFRLVDDDPDRLRRAQLGDIPAGFMRMEKSLPKDDPDRGVLGKGWMLVQAEDMWGLSGSELAKTYRTTDDVGGYAVGFTWKPDAANRFADLTGANKGRQLAIILDDILQSAPVIRSQIRGSGVIEGGFSETERDNLLYVLQSGSLPVGLALEGKSYVGATLGTDSIQRGIKAIIIGGILVMLIMALYYRGCGLVANFALLLNLVLICGVLALFRATLTLPGMAGLLLTVGMAVDANVLIFERIREELDRGRGASLALKNGYERAFKTIFDANLTTVITALILYRVGTATVKGFAVTLIAGIVCSMFTAIYVSRGVFRTFLDSKIMREFKMTRIFGTSSFRLVRRTALMMGITGALIVAGLAIFATRGRLNLLDTDFLGGSYLQLTLREETGIADVRQRLEEAGIENVQVTTRQDDRMTVGETTAREFGLRARLASGEDMEKAVSAFEESVREVFKDDIDVQEVSATIQIDKIPEGGAGATDPFLGHHRAIIRFEKDLRRDFFERGLKKAGFARSGGENRGVERIYELDSGSAASEKSTSRTYTVKLREKDADLLRESLKDAFAAPIYFKQVEYVGAVVAKEMQSKAVQAILWSLVAIVVYVSFRFGRMRYGLAAVVALVHDVAFTMGAIALFNYITLEMPQFDLLGVGELRINLPVVAGLLTIIGYSLNDTIVVFDRIRENVAGKPGLSTEIIDKSINQTLRRTIMTSLTTFIAVLMLYIVGGHRIHSFALVMLIGVIVGTYSSIFIASPILLSPKHWRGATEKT